MLSFEDSVGISRRRLVELEFMLTSCRSFILEVYQCIPIIIQTPAVSDRLYMAFEFVLSDRSSAVTLIPTLGRSKISLDRLSDGSGFSSLSQVKVRPGAGQHRTVSSRMMDPHIL